MKSSATMELIFLIVLLQIGTAFPIQKRAEGLLLERQNDYYAPVSDSHSTMTIPSPTTDPKGLGTNTGSLESLALEDPGVQDKGIFSAIGRAFKSLFHIGDSAAVKALKKSMPTFENALKVKNSLPAQKHYSQLSASQRVIRLREGQLVMSQRKSQFYQLAAGTSEVVNTENDKV